MIHKVLTYGHGVLKQKAEPVAQVDEDIRQLVKDLLGTMYRANGVGLAAQQIGRTEAVCVVDVSPRGGPGQAAASTENPSVAPMPLVMINPRITHATGEQRIDEGCLSFPEIYVAIRRAAEITARFTDADGNDRTVSADGLLARAIQHEVDHLNGVLLVDRMSATQKMAISGRLRRLRRQAEEEIRV